MAALPAPRTIVITGASGGIGSALARAYAAPGRILALLGRDEARLETVAQTCRAAGATAETACLDVTDTARMGTWLVAFDQRHPVDLVIANAGVSSSNAANGAPETADVAARTIAVDLVGVVNTIAPLLPGMRERARGQVAIVGSLASLYPFPSTPAYSAAKAGALFYGRALIPVLARDGISVTVICSGFVETAMSQRVRGPRPLVISADDAAQRIVGAIARGRHVVAFPRRLALGLRLLAMLPAPWAYFCARPFLYTVDPTKD